MAMETTLGANYIVETYLFGNLRTGAKKFREQNFEFWGRAKNIGV
jgi:hypothetical protein